MCLLFCCNNFTKMPLTINLTMSIMTNVTINADDRASTSGVGEYFTKIFSSGCLESMVKKWT